MSVGTEGLSRNRYLLLVVDKASKSPFAFPLPSKQAEEVARHLLQLCLTFGVPRVIRSDGGGEFEARCIQHLCRWLKADIQYGPADHPRGQGAVERLGGWIQDVLSELCVPWPERWDEYVPPACWIKQSMPDPALPGNMSPFEILFGRKPRTSLDTLVPHMDDSEAAEGLDSFIEKRRQVLREVRQVLEKKLQSRIATRERVNAGIAKNIGGSNCATRRLSISEKGREHQAPQW